MKIVVIVLSLLFCTGMVVAGVLAQQAGNKVADGVNNFACDLAQLMNVTLSGNEVADPTSGFMGLLPTVTWVEAFEKTIADGSPFLTDLGKVLDDTSEIDRALLVTTETLNLMAYALKLPENEVPTGSTPSYHKCKTCGPLAEEVTKTNPPGIVESLKVGSAQATRDARAEVQKQLQGDNLKSLQSQMKDNLKPIGSAKSAMVDMLGGLLELKELDEKETLTDNLSHGIQGFAAVTGIATWASLIVAILFALRSDKNPEDLRDGVNPYYSGTGWCGCCVWWCGCWGMLLAFFFGGLLWFTSVPLSGMCVVLAELDTSTLDKYGGPLGLTKASEDSGDGGGGDSNMMIDVIKTCLLSDGDGELLNAVSVPGKDGTKITMKQKLQVEVKDQIDSAFAVMDTKTESKLAEDENFKKLRSDIGKGIAYTIIMSTDQAITSDFWANNKYKAMALQFGVNNGHAALREAAQTTSLTCPDVEGIHGVNNFITELKDNTGAVVTGTGTTAACTDANFCCWTKNIDCAGIVDAATQAACEAGKNYVAGLKGSLMRQAPKDYKCAYFVDKNGNECDTLGMSKDVNGKWINDCLRETVAGGKTTYEMKTMTKDCNIIEFDQYMRNYDARLGKVASRLDESAPAMKARIDQDLKTLVNRDITSQIDEFVKHARCEFMSTGYLKMIDGLCYEMGIGFRSVAQSYVALACMVMFSSILCWFIFRRQLDNYTVWRKNAAKVVNF